MKKKIREMILDGIPTAKIIKWVMDNGETTNGAPMTYNAAQKRVRRVRETMKKENEQTEVVDKELVPISQTFDGTKNQTTFIGRIKLPANGNVTDQQVLKAYGLKPDEWKITSFTVNEWEGPVKGGGVNNYRQFKLVVAPTILDNVSTKSIVEFFNEYLDSREPKTAKIPFSKQKESGEDANNCTGYVAEIVGADFHFNMQASEFDGEHHTPDECKENLLNAIREILSKIKRYNIPIKRFVFSIVGDVSHTDNEKQTTPHGTFQQVQHRMFTAITYLSETFEEAIGMLTEVADVEVIYVKGNHDKTIGPLAMSLLAANLAKKYANGVHKHKVIACDVTPAAHKYGRYGKAVIVWTHGDIPQSNLNGLVFSTAQEFSDEDIRYVHAGHIHSNKAFVTNDGTTIQHYECLCPSSEWEADMAFPKSGPMVRTIKDGETIARRRHTLFCNLWDTREAKRPDVLTGSTC